MERILMDLNKTPGIIGSFVIAPDGIIIASDYSSDMDEERMGAIISSIINATEKAIQKLQMGKLTAFIIEAEQVKIFFQIFKLGFLVTVAHKDANLGLVRVETKSAASKLSNIGLSTS